MTLARVLTAASVAALLSVPAFAQDSRVPKPTPEPAPGAPKPAAAQAPAPAPTAAPTPAAQADVVETLRARGQFSTFLKIVDAAGLTATLKGASAITVFAPTDQAFAALPAGTVEAWLKPENKEQLRKVVLYHTINASVSSAQLVNRKGGVRTGADVEVLLDGGGGQIKADGANVTQADVKATNGAVFVIDKVLTPGAAAAPSPAPKPGALATRGYLVLASYQDQSKGDDQPPGEKPPADDQQSIPAPDQQTPPAPTQNQDAPAAAPAPTTGDDQSAAPEGDIARKKAGDPGVVSNQPVPNPPEKPKKKKPHKA